MSTCCREHLAGKTVVLATHHHQFAREADLVCLMENGALVGSGSYNHVIGQQSKSPFLPHFTNCEVVDHGEKRVEHRQVAVPRRMLKESELNRPKIGSETRAAGVVKLSTYKNYAVASKSTTRLLVYVVSLFSANAVSCWSAVLLGKWSTIGAGVHLDNSSANCLLDFSSPFGAHLQGCNELYLVVYVGSLLTYALLAFVYAVTFFVICTSASRWVIASVKLNRA